MEIEHCSCVLSKHVASLNKISGKQTLQPENHGVSVMQHLSRNLTKPIGKGLKGAYSYLRSQLHQVVHKKKTYHATKLKHMFPCFFPKWCIVVIQTETSWRFLGSAKTNPNKRSGPARSPARSPCLKWSSSSSTGNKRKGMWRTAGFPARAVSF